jgi:raffinose/stachyose/melibiose transport system permease protein
VALQAPVVPPVRTRRRRRATVHVPFWFVLPAAAVFTFTVLVPSAQGIAYSFTDWDGLTQEVDFVGVANFARIFSDGRAAAPIVNTLVLAVVVLIFQNLFGLLLALGLNSIVKSRHVLRVVFFVPVVLTPLVAGYVWSYLLSPRGALNGALDAVGLGALGHDWLGSPDTALLSICVAVVWQFSGYSMVIYLAGLQAIPTEVTEAALLDGAGPVRRLRSIILPLINGALVINLLLTLVGSLSQFDQVMAMTSGGPGNATQTISTTIYKVGISAGDYPYGIALSVVMAAMVAVAAVAQYRLTSRKVQL